MSFPNQRDVDKLEPEDIGRWITSYYSLLSKTFYQHDDQHHSLFVIDEKQAKSFCADVLISACLNLLDEDGKLKSDVIAANNLQDFIKQSDSLTIDKLTNSMLYEYTKNIIIRNIEKQIAKLAHQFNHDGDNNDEGSNSQADLDTQDRIKMIDECLQNIMINEDEYTPFFQEVVANYKAIFIEGNLANYLREQSLETLAQILKKDLAMVEPDAMPFKYVYAKMRFEREHFWMHVMEILYEDRDTERMQVIWNHLSQANRESWNHNKNYPRFAPEKSIHYRGIAIEEPTINLPPKERTWGMNTLTRILNARDNKFLIDQIISEMHPDQRKLAKKVLAELQAVKFNNQWIQKPARELFLLMVKRSQDAESMKNILLPFMPDMQKDLNALADFPQPLFPAKKRKLVAVTSIDPTRSAKKNKP